MEKLAIDAQRLKDIQGIIAFRFLKDEEIAKLLETASLLRFGQGEVLIEEGEVSPFIYGVVEGTLTVSVKEASGKQIYVSSLGSGEVFGEAGIFIKVKRTARVCADGESLIVRIHRQDLIDFIRAQPEAGNKFMFVIVFGLLRKLRVMNLELAFERKDEVGQEDIDAIMGNFFKEQGM